MKKFVTKVVYFPVPLIILLLVVELHIAYTANSFNVKAEFIQQNKDVEAIFLGSSHSMDAINPEFLDFKAANLAYGGQDYQLDSALFFNYIKELPQIKYVFIEVDYHSLAKKNPVDFYRFSWYSFYHNIAFPETKLVDKYFLYQSNPQFFNQRLIRQLNPFSTDLQLNEFGFATNVSEGVFKSLNYNDELIRKTAVERFKHKGGEYSSKQNYDYNERTISSVINYCLENNIVVFLLKTPLYPTYTERYEEERLNRRNMFIKRVLENESVILLDFEHDNRFQVKDFKNDDHLNSHGAKKLTLMLDSAVMDKNRTLSRNVRVLNEGV
ncbi:hypothetical protein K3G39_19845 [Pontibacter sp. HSC-14F20]|uniref:hypothetical protein n=1 Tax=Pontibacter sp. HSC-14F20 TaxID=2864136 RepID=UPI001C731CFE|nr:hypothetical protein [Pontibacter sp. HSC-14F20]MBX0335493.1 hypothetical protein [Pontibacter sp. HSC-14F20]